MKQRLLIIAFLFACALVQAGTSNLDVNPFLNDKTFSFELKANATQNALVIVTDAKIPMEIKIIDKSGYVRIRKELHMDREIDLSLLIEGFYLIKVHAGNHVEVKRFYKGKDGLDIR